MNLKKLLRLNRFRKRPTVPAAAGPIRWSVLYNRAVILALEPGLDPAAISISLQHADGRLLTELGAMPVLVERPGYRTAIYELDPDIFARPASARIVATTVGGAHVSELFALGSGAFVGTVDGVQDYQLTGWVSPLFDIDGFEVEFIADGRTVARMRPNRLRDDLIASNRHAGWNGYSFPLPDALLDGFPHDLAVRAGTQLFGLPGWAAAPRFNIDNLERDRLTGWVFDPACIDVPAQLRLMDGEREVAHVRTDFRPDLKALFGRNAAGFAFDRIRVEGEHELVLGPKGSGKVIGRVVENALIKRVGAKRKAARARLLSSLDGRATRPARDAIRQDLAAIARLDPHRTLAFVPASQPEPQPEPQPPPAAWPGVRTLPPVCAIVPVFRGLADLRLCLDSVMAQLEDGRVRAIIVNDASPEPGIADYLESLASRPNVTLLTNPQNLGFVGAVNRGLASLGPGEDAVIVNADTVLAPRTFAKLAALCHGRAGVASVTPMSNNATILSFPAPLLANPAPLGLGTEAIDATFEALEPEPVEIPTAVGFCMYMNRRALDEIGPFSAEWGRGYCEEVDWSLAARDLGWTHLAATNCFVMHEGSVSFGAAERGRILAVNHARLETKYPEYLEEVRGIILADPFGQLRQRALAVLLCGRFQRVTLHVLHGLGGGTKRYVDDLSALPRDDGHELAILTPIEGEFGTPRLRIGFDRCRAEIDISPSDFGSFLGLLEAAGLDLLVHVNSRLALPSAMLDAIAEPGRAYVVTLHDYQWYCPKVHLIDERVFYCGEPPPEVCQLCVRHEQTHDFVDHDAMILANIHDWLAYNERFLRGARRIIAPSEDTAARYQRRLGLGNMVHRPHPEPALALSGARPPRPAAGVLRIAIIGAIGYHKGFDLVVRTVELASMRRLPVQFRVIGYTPDGERLTRLTNAEVTGRYEPADLGRLLDEYAPDYVLLPSVWPETYSYVVSEAWAAGYPVVAFDFGAQAERIRATGAGILIPPTRDAGVFLDALMAAWDQVAAGSACRPEARETTTLEAYYDGDAQVEHATSGAHRRTSR